MLYTLGPVLNIPTTIFVASHSGLQCSRYHLNSSYSIFFKHIHHGAYPRSKYCSYAFLAIFCVTYDTYEYQPRILGPSNRSTIVKNIIPHPYLSYCFSFYQLSLSGLSTIFHKNKMVNCMSCLALLQQKNMRDTSL